MQNPNELKEYEGDGAKSNLSMLEKNVLSGFNLAISSGPLCNEPVSGVVFVLENFSLEEKKDELDSMLLKLKFSIAASITFGADYKCCTKFFFGSLFPMVTETFAGSLYL